MDRASEHARSGGICPRSLLIRARQVGRRGGPGVSRFGGTRDRSREVYGPSAPHACRTISRRASRSTGQRGHLPVSRQPPSSGRGPDAPSSNPNASRSGSSPGTGRNSRADPLPHRIAARGYPAGSRSPLGSALRLRARTTQRVRTPLRPASATSPRGPPACGNGLLPRNAGARREPGPRMATVISI